MADLSDTQEIGAVKEKKMTAEQIDVMTQLLKMEERTAMWQRITGLAMIALVVVIGIALLVVVPKVTNTVKQLSETMEKVDTLSVQVGKSLEEIDVLVGQAEGAVTNIDTMVKNVDSFVTDNTDNVNEAVVHFNEIDFDGLNAAIEDLKDVVEPLANFARRFK